VVELEKVSKKMSHGSYNKKNLLIPIVLHFLIGQTVTVLAAEFDQLPAVHVLHNAARRDPEVVLNQQRWEAATIEQATLTLCRNMIL
jgi:hypothetical protein